MMVPAMVSSAGLPPFPQLTDAAKHQIQSWGSWALHPIDSSMGNGKGRASSWS